MRKLSKEISAEYKVKRGKPAVFSFRGESFNLRTGGLKQAQRLMDLGWPHISKKPPEKPSSESSDVG